jgi:uncharacterized protein
MPWTPRDPAPLLHHAPSRGRALAEAALVLVTVFVPAHLAALPGRAPLVAVSGVLALWGLALLRPASDWREGRRARALLQGPLLLLALGASTASGWFQESASAPPRLGVTTRRGTPTGVELTEVRPGRPAAGLLEVGDRVLAVDDVALSAEAPEEDFRARVREAGGGERTQLRLSVERAGEAREVRVPVGPERSARLFQHGAMTWLCLRALGMSLLVALLLWRQGQGAAQVGLVREGAGRELLWGLPTLVGTYAVLLAASLPLSLLALLLKLTQREALARRELVGALTEMGLGVPAFAAAMVLVTGFEELVFRGFLVPRLRVVTGRWTTAVGVCAVLFGLGHVYEGPLAAVQTAVLGAWFSAVFLWRGRLPSVMVAHAAFNTLNFSLMLWLQRSGLLEKLTQHPPP